MTTYNGLKRGVPGRVEVLREPVGRLAIFCCPIEASCARRSDDTEAGWFEVASVDPTTQQSARSIRINHPAVPVARSKHQKIASGRLVKDYLAQAYASTRGSAPALSTPVFGSMAMAAFEPNDHAPADCNI